MKITSLVLGSLFLCGCSGTTQISTSDQAAQLEDARRLMADGQIDEALTVTDGILNTSPDNRDARLLAADGNLALSELGRSNTEALLMDAARNLERALELDPQDPDSWVKLADTRYRLSEFEAGRDAALEAARLLKEAEASPEDTTAAVLAAARNEMQLFVAARQLELAESDGDKPPRAEPATMQLAEQVLAHLQYAKQVAPGVAYVQSAQVYQWLGQTVPAQEELERGIRAAPTESDLHIAYQNTFFQRSQQRACVGAYRRLLREKPNVPILLWYQGRAQVALADDLRRQDGWPAAIDAYNDAADSYGQYRAMAPSHVDAADQWLAICDLSIARVAIDSGDVDAAIEHVDAAYENTPRVAEYADGVPLLYDSFGSHYTAVIFQINGTLSQNLGLDGLKRTLGFNEAIIERHPGTFGFVYNNAGFTAREIGSAYDAEGRAEGATQEQRTAATERAMAEWEKSYAYYEKAVKLSPEDARIINDCGLMLIYHLNREFDRARQLFDRAIAVGQPQLDELPEDTDEGARQNLEEAVGDAWENIGVLMARHLGKPFTEYKPFLEKAVQYFPYQRRTAAAMLRSEGGALPVGGAGQLGAAAVAAQQDSRAPAFAKVEQQAKAKADAGDLDGALLVFDGAIKQLGEYAPFRALFGDYTLRYANAARDAGRTAGLEHLYGDAVRNLKKAVELDSEPVAPRLMLCQALYESGEFAAAGVEADSLISHVRSQGGGADEEVVAAQRIRGLANTRVFIAAKQNEENGDEALGDARTAFRTLETGGQLDDELCRTWVTLEQWAGAEAEAIQVLVRALRRKPDDQTMMGQLVDAAVGANQSALAVAALEKRSDATGLWYLGRARFFSAEDLRTGGTEQFPAALQELDSAREAFEKSMAANPVYTDSCQQWIAMCVGKKGIIDLAREDLQAAELELIEAARLRPDRIADSLGGVDSVKRGILVLADRYYQKGDLGKVESIYRAATAAAPEEVDFANNHGLFARDYGNQLERDGKSKEAAEMYEASYASYTRACELDPQNVRLRNDRALILVYHLQREWEVVEQLLTDASVDGVRQLEESPPADPQARRDLEEAVGDCFENLALYHLRHTGDLDKASVAAEKSKEFYPGERRPGARRHLAEVERRKQEGKGQ